MMTLDLKLSFLDIWVRGEQLKDLFSLREKVKDFVNTFSEEGSTTIVEIIAISTEFYLRYDQTFSGKVATKDFKLDKKFLEKQEQSKYPVYIQLYLSKSLKKHIKSNIDQLAAILANKYSSLHTKVNNFIILGEIFSFVLENVKEIKEFFNNGKESIGPPSFKTLVADKKYCSICGGDICTPLSSDILACGRCTKFFELHSKSEAESWECRKQSGFCAIVPSFQYKDNRLFFTNSLTGEMKVYASNSNVLCKRCRYLRCVAVGMKEPTKIVGGMQKWNAEEQTKKVECLENTVEGLEVKPSPLITPCIVCESRVEVNKLKICLHCQTFLSDSVEESSHYTIACMKSSVCEVTSKKTSTFSACTGCWMSKTRKLGVLEEYLATLQSTREQSIENEEGVNAGVGTTGCAVCGRITDNTFQTKLCCGVCKRFFLKSVKSRCFKDFCCSGNSRCEISGGQKLQCSQCWWTKCISKGLKVKK